MKLRTTVLTLSLAAALPSFAVRTRHQRGHHRDAHVRPYLHRTCLQGEGAA